MGIEATIKAEDDPRGLLKMDTEPGEVGWYVTQTNLCHVPGSRGGYIEAGKFSTVLWEASKLGGPSPEMIGPAVTFSPGQQAVEAVLKLDEKGEPVLDGEGKPVVLVGRKPSYDEIMAGVDATGPGLRTLVYGMLRGIFPGLAGKQI